MLFVPLALTVQVFPHLPAAALLGYATSSKTAITKGCIFQHLQEGAKMYLSRPLNLVLHAQSSRMRGFGYRSGFNRNLVHDFAQIGVLLDSYIWVMLMLPGSPGDG